MSEEVRQTGPRESYFQQEGKRGQQETAKRWVINVDGEQVWTADFVMQQMMAQGRRIDRVKAMAKVALLAALVALVIAIAAIVKCS